MRILLLCSSDYMAIPAALVLQQQGHLCGIALPAKHKKRLLPSFVQSGFKAEEIHLLIKEALEQQLLLLIDDCKAEALFVITFPWQLSTVVLQMPVYGCINFHPGLLPKYRGADPIFWQLKNREMAGGFSIHRMTEGVDEGPILLQKELSIIPGETYGMHVKRLGLFAAEIVGDAIATIKADKPATNQPQHHAQYFKKPDKPQVSINWATQTAEEIEALVNAANPLYGGAFTSIRSMEMALLEVSFAAMPNAPAHITPGTIVYADELYGLIVACKENQFVKINMVNVPDGYFSGSKLYSLGFRAGEVFVS